jgi:5-methyltetrahydrofolate--homocysteine methyltransferase
MGGAGDRGAILFATVENDIHDIGKNIVMTLAESNNYRVIDLGVNVAAERIVEAAIEHSPEIIALSALMTTTAPQMEEVVRLLRE